MGRLIDADAFKDFVHEHCKDSLADLWCDLINKQPTAYDVDKVVEQLKAEADRWAESGIEYDDKRERGVAEGYRLAIKIVKAGGVEDE